MTHLTSACKIARLRAWNLPHRFFFLSIILFFVTCFSLPSSSPQSSFFFVLPLLWGIPPAPPLPSSSTSYPALSVATPDLTFPRQRVNRMQVSPQLFLILKKKSGNLGRSKWHVKFPGIKGSGVGGLRCGGGGVFCFALPYIRVEGEREG